MRAIKGLMGVAAAVMLAVAGTGCTNNLKAEQSRLMAENTALRDQLGEYEEALQSAERQRSEIAAEAARYRAENRRLQDQARQQPVAAPAARTGGFEGISGVGEEFRPGEVAAVVEGDILFDSGRVTLKPASKQTLDQIARVLNSTYAGRTIRIEGHTDTDPIRRSEWKTNDRLSAERAMAVKAYLESKGVSGSRMYIAGWGPNKPRGSKAQSRRVEIIVLLQ